RYADECESDSMECLARWSGQLLAMSSRFPRPNRHAPGLTDGGGDNGDRVLRVKPVARLLRKRYQATTKTRQADFAEDVTQTRDGIDQHPLKMDLLELPTRGLKHH